MKRHRSPTSKLALALLLAVALLLPRGIEAHCDGMDSPVVGAAQRALETANVNLVLIWVQKQDEPAIRKAFEKTLAVRKLDSRAKELADLYFFETLVGVHRAGEGAPHTGLKLARRDLGPAIPAADHAIETGAIEPVFKLLTDEIRTGLTLHFKEVIAKKNVQPDHVDAGREYVKAYVEFIHYVEGIHQASSSATVHGHFDESEGSASHKHEL